MRIAVLSDIHGNLEAFQAVLDDIHTQDIGKIISLGDLIDYGPDSEIIIQEHIRLNIASIQGNHENALINIGLLQSFSSIAYNSMKITRKHLSRESKKYIQTLPLFLSFDQMRFVHALPPDSVTRYIDFVPPHILGYIAESYPEPICFVGHTHKLGVYECSQKKVNFFRPAEKQIILNPAFRNIINVGSVGQPRDRDKHAKYAIYDNTLNSLVIRLIDYDAQKTAKKILKLGYPEKNAQRLL
ncbi:metallophosphatase family protein [bacterium]|nr:metallophosphatase family protein [bacterium]MBU1063620.1 metallophosphatase family protein [bacterium]MBU1875424.1 metallophosphatase family protein [bacterium]